jgi:hypothetical protein
MFILHAIIRLYVRKMYVCGNLKIWRVQNYNVLCTIYTYIYIYIYISTYKHIYIYISTYKHIYIYVYESVHSCEHVHIFIVHGIICIYGHIRV